MSYKKIELPIDPERIIPIEPDSKYFVVMPVGATHGELWETSVVLKNFMDSPNTFFVLPGDIAVIRIEDGETEVLYQPKETSEAADEKAVDDGTTAPEMHSAAKDVPEP